MTSAEPARTSAYSADIAVRVVWQRLGMGITCRDIAKRLQIGLGCTGALLRREISRELSVLPDDTPENWMSFMNCI